MLPSDVFCRAAVFPRMLKSQQFDEETLLSFSNVNDGRKAISFASHSICQDDDGVHTYGLHVASSRNEREQNELGRALSDDEAHHYLGFYSFNARFLHCIKLTFCVGRLYHAPEDGQDCHFQFDLTPLNDATARQVKQDERIARSRLAQALFGPVLLPSHRCSTHAASLQGEFMPLKERAIGSNSDQTKQN